MSMGAVQLVLSVRKAIAGVGEWVVGSVVGDRCGGCRV